MTFPGPKLGEFNFSVKLAIDGTCQVVPIRSQNESIHPCNFLCEIQFLEQLKTK